MKLHSLRNVNIINYIFTQYIIVGNKKSLSIIMQSLEYKVHQLSASDGGTSLTLPAKGARGRRGGFGWLDAGLTLPAKEGKRGEGLEGWMPA